MDDPMGEVNVDMCVLPDLSAREGETVGWAVDRGHRTPVTSLDVLHGEDANVSATSTGVGPTVLAVSAASSRSPSDPLCLRASESMGTVVSPTSHDLPSDFMSRRDTSRSRASTSERCSSGNDSPTPTLDTTPTPTLTLPANPMTPTPPGIEVSSTYRPAPGHTPLASAPSARRSYASTTAAKKIFPANSESWRREWYSEHKRAPSSQPEALILKALSATPEERRSLLQATPCATENSQEFWIPAPELTQTFPLAVIMDSLFACDFPLWQAACPDLFGFAMVRGKGVRFFSSNHVLTTSLRNLKLPICGYDHVIHASSMVGQYYWVNLNRVPATVNTLDVYDFFVEHDCAPLYVFPMHSVGSLQSNALTVIFNSKQVPPFLWSQKPGDAPLREIQLSAADPPTFVVHKNSALNEVVPPSLQQKRRKVSPVPPTPPTARPTTPAPPKPAPVKTPSVKVSAPNRKDTPSAWHTKVKSRVLSVPTSKLPVEALPVSNRVDDTTSSRHWFVPVENRFEILAHDPTHGVPDYDVKVFLNPSTLAVCEPLPKPSPKLLTKSLANPFHVDHITSDALDAAIREFCTATLEDTPYGDAFLGALQAQPSFFRSSLDDPDLTDYWVAKATEHALSRLLCQSHPSSFREGKHILPIEQVLSDYCALRTDGSGDVSTPAYALERLCAEFTPQFTAQDHIQLALWDLFAMVTAPSVYFDPIKLSHAINNPALESIDCTSALLWSDDILVDWSASQLGQTMLSSAVTEPFSLAFQSLIQLGCSPNP